MTIDKNDSIYWTKQFGNSSFTTNFNYEIVKLIDIWLAQGLNFSPNDISAFSIPFCILTIILFYLNSYWAAPFFYFVILLDYTDGYVARKHDKESHFGDYFDHIRDTIFMIAFIIVLIIKIFSKKQYLCLNIIITIIISYLLFYGFIKYANNEVELSKHTEYNKSTIKVQEVLTKINDPYKDLSIICNATSFFLITIFIIVLIYQQRNF